MWHYFRQFAGHCGNVSNTPTRPVDSVGVHVPSSTSSSLWVSALETLQGPQGEWPQPQIPCSLGGNWGVSRGRGIEKEKKTQLFYLGSLLSSLFSNKVFLSVEVHSLIPWVLFSHSLSPQTSNCIKKAYLRKMNQQKVNPQRYLFSKQLFEFR